jgi:large subunit ribosomal protein L5
MARLMERFKTDIKPGLQRDLGITNVHATPRLLKIVVSMGLGKSVSEKNERRVEAAVAELSRIVGQKPLICKATKSVSNFNLREGMNVGAKVTLRGARMYEFLDRLISVAIPRVRDFRGLNPNGFDGRGNYNLGLTEQTIFPEINVDNVQYQQGMNVTLVTSASNDEQGRMLLTRLGLPLRES